MTLSGSVAPAVLLPSLASVAACLAVSVYLFLMRRLEVSHRRQVAAAGQVLAPYLIGAEGLGLAVVEAIEDFGRLPVLQVLRGARRRIRGAAAQAIADTLNTLGEVERLARASRSPFRARRLASLWGLGECGGELARSELLRALVHADPQTRSLAREALVLLDDQEASSAATASFLAEPAHLLPACRRFLRWLALRQPALLEQTCQAEVSPAHRQLIETALEGGDLGADGGVIAEERGLEASLEDGTLASEEWWLDRRTSGLGATLLFRSSLGSELALGLALLGAAISGGAIAWILYR